MSSEPFTVKWGIFGPGRIAALFINDLIHSKDELRKEVLSGEIKHELVAIASNSNIKNAETFKKNVFVADDQYFKNKIVDSKTYDAIQCYGKYTDLLTDENVDIVYIATPNHNHFELCYKTLMAGKRVLMEKPFTINHKQAEILINLAKEKSLFLMEAFWTKFNPVFRDLHGICFDEKLLGDIKRVHSDLSFYFNQEDPLMDRVYNPSLGGGCALDIGIYALNWQMGFLDHDNYDPDYLPQIKSMINRSNTGVDMGTAILLRFGDEKLGIATCSGFFTNAGKGVIIQGTKGRAEVDSSCRSTSYTVFDNDNNVLKSVTYKFDGHAMFFEADHAALCLKRGLLESDIHSSGDTLKISKILDLVRQENDIVYPDTLESLDI